MPFSTFHFSRRHTLFIRKILCCVFLGSIMMFSSGAQARIQTHDMTDGANYNFRLDGAAAGDWFGFSNIQAADLNDNGKDDLLIGSWFADNNGRANSGSLWVIYDDLLDAAGTGNTIDLSNSANYNLRYDGALASHFFSIGAIHTADLDDDGKLDILASSYGAGYNGRASSGSLYVISGTLIDDYAGTGNNIDLATATNWNIRYDGDATSAQLTFSKGLSTADLDDNGKLDLLIGSRVSDKNGRTDSGSLWIIYDSLIDDYAGTGNTIDLVTATNWNIRYDGAEATEVLSNGLPQPQDLDNDGKVDLVIGGYGRDNFTSDEGVVYVIYNTLIDDYAGTGNIVDLLDPDNFNILYLAAFHHGGFGVDSAIADLDNDGKMDLLVDAHASDHGGDISKGFGLAFIFYGTLIDDYVGTGNEVDMNLATSYNLRFRGAHVNQRFGDYPNMVDIDSDGLLDIIFRGTSPEELTDMTIGTVYTISNELTSGYGGTGNHIDMGDVDNYTLRYDGTPGYFFGEHVIVGDINGDGQQDLLMPVRGADFNARTDSGSVIIVLNFPHDITFAAANAVLATSSYTLNGTITATNSVTTPTGVQYLIDSNSLSGNWRECEPADGTFDALTEDFTCAITGLSASVAHTVYVRAYDENGNYTAQQSYATFAIAPGAGGGGGGGGGSGGGGRGSRGDSSAPDPTDSSSDDSGPSGEEEPPISSELPFSDVPEDAWFAPFVEVLYQAGIISGYGDEPGMFAPDHNLTRAEFIKILVTLLVPENAEEGADFADTAEHRAAAVIRSARAQGWVKGYEGGIFRPDAPIIRAEVTKIITLAFGFTLPEEAGAGDESPFSDVTAEDWFFSFLQILQVHGIINGYPDGTFLPHAPILRAEIAKIVAKAAEKSGLEL